MPSFNVSLPWLQKLEVRFFSQKTQSNLTPTKILETNITSENQKTFSLGELSG